MTDTKFFRVMAVLQLFIAFINFYVANSAAREGTVLAIAMGAICTMAGVFCTVTAAKMWGALD